MDNRPKTTRDAFDDLAAAWARFRDTLYAALRGSGVDRVIRPGTRESALPGMSRNLSRMIAAIVVAWLAILVVGILWRIAIGLPV